MPFVRKKYIVPPSVKESSNLIKFIANVISIYVSKCLLWMEEVHLASWCMCLRFQKRVKVLLAFLHISICIYFGIWCDFVVCSRMSLVHFSWSARFVHAKQSTKVLASKHFTLPTTQFQNFAPLQGEATIWYVYSVTSCYCLLFIAFSPQR
jgi:hypothetical protein